jgi:ribosomal-protein-alanine N-acetyltransferase
VSRVATIVDLERVVAIDRACFARAWTEDAWRAEIEAGSVLLGVNPLGFACAPIVLDTCELRRIAVLPEARGQGLGRDLLLAVIAHARSRGCVRVELEVASTNAEAIGLYRRAGFVDVGRRANYYRDPPADALLMTLELITA